MRTQREFKRTIVKEVLRRKKFTRKRALRMGAVGESVCEKNASKVGLHRDKNTFLILKKTRGK